MQMMKASSLGLRARLERRCLMTWSRRAIDEVSIPIGLRARLERCCLMTRS